MFDRIVNSAYNIVRDWSNTTFCIIMGVLITSAFYFLSLFLKANKKEAPKVAKISYLLITIFLLIVFVTLANMRY